jgi:hypothetical protein
MEDEKRLFYEKLDEYESKLPQKHDKEKFVLSSEKYNLILECVSCFFFNCQFKLNGG